MLTPRHVRDLQVEPAHHLRGEAHLSAASGLVCDKDRLYVVSDDEHHLGVFEATASTPVRLHRILEGDLPQDTGIRKKRKPDLEALALLPAAAGRPHRTLLALGSGSKPNRQLAFAIELDEFGDLAGAANAIDLSSVYESLRPIFPRLNIEGAFVADGHLCLLQRGNKGDGRNACIEYSLSELYGWMAGRRDVAPGAVRITEFALGEVDGVPLGFTDGAALRGGGWLFSAVAEDTDDSYVDGACRGSAIGWVSARGQLGRVMSIVGAPKIEGVALHNDGRLLMVTDSDDPAIASQLLTLDAEQLQQILSPDPLARPGA